MEPTLQSVRYELSYCLYYSPVDCAVYGGLKQVMNSSDTSQVAGDNNIEKVAERKRHNRRKLQTEDYAYLGEDVPEQPVLGFQGTKNLLHLMLPLHITIFHKLRKTKKTAQKKLITL